MAIYRIHKTSDYTVMSNAHLRDRNLSLKAKGLLSIMLSLPEEWDYSVTGLSSICKEKESAIVSALKELKTNRYLIVNKKLPNETKSGRMEYEYNVFEIPQEEETEKQGVEKQGVEKQGVENLGLEILGLENQGQLNTNKLNTDKLNTYFFFSREGERPSQTEGEKTTEKPNLCENCFHELPREKLNLSAEKLNFPDTEKEKKKEKDSNNNISSSSIGGDRPSRCEENEQEQLYTGSAGEGVLHITKKEFDDLTGRMGKEELNRYIGIIVENEKKGHHYRKKTHYQAILDMAESDRKNQQKKPTAVNRGGNSSFNADEFFAKALKKSYGG